MMLATRSQDAKQAYNESILATGQKPTLLFRYIMRARRGDIFDEGEIMRGMRFALNRRGFKNHGLKPAQNERYEDERRELLEVLLDQPRVITQAHTDKGLKWWASMHKADGSWRDNVFTRSVDHVSRSIIDTFHHFEFIGYVDTSQNTMRWYQPVYRVYDNQGRHFDYTASSWQHDGGIEIDPPM